jgi:hypothetical protein
MWLRVTRRRCRRRQRLRGLHRGSAGVRPTLRPPSLRQPRTVDPVERGPSLPTGGTAQADSLVVAPLPRPTWAVAVWRSRSVEQPLPDTRSNLFLGRFGMGAKVFRGNHLHAEICQLKGHLDTGPFPVEHINILSRRSDSLGLQEVGEDPVVLVPDPFGIERPSADSSEGFCLRREVFQHGVERAVVEETLLIRVAHRVGVGPAKAPSNTWPSRPSSEYASTSAWSTHGGSAFDAATDDVS